jgi:hypothetical protein
VFSSSLIARENCDCQLCLYIFAIVFRYNLGGRGGGGGGCKKTIGQIKDMLKKFLWGGIENKFKSMVKWSYYCTKKAIWGIGFNKPK